MVPRFGDSDLFAYSAEHVAYEFEMFFWLARVCGNPSIKLGAPSSAADAARLNNVLIESFVVHLRNVIEFFYDLDPRPTDVVAADFLSPSRWEALRPEISDSLRRARTRANKEIAHLTTDRISGNPPNKGWDFQELAKEIEKLVRCFAAEASPSRLSHKVADVLP
jgi:hypothetical protein